MFKMHSHPRMHVKVSTKVLNILFYYEKVDFKSELDIFLQSLFRLKMCLRKKKLSEIK